MTKKEIQAALISEGFQSNYSGKTKTLHLKTENTPSEPLLKEIEASGFLICSLVKTLET